MEELADMVSHRYQTNLLAITSGLAIFVFGGFQTSNQANSVAPNACVTIQQISPEMTKVDDSGRTTEPIRITINAQGSPEDLKKAEVVYLEDGVERSAIPLGDLHTGVQTVIVPPGLHMTSSSQLFDMALLRPDGTETPASSEVLHGPNATRPKEAAFPPLTKEEEQEEEDSAQPIATIEPGVDREEALSITQFDRDEVAITSEDGFAKETSGDDSKLPPQIYTLHGVNFKDGMLVRFSTMKGGRSVEATSPLMHTKVIATLGHEDPDPDWKPTNPTALMTADVAVPLVITHTAQGGFSVRTAHSAPSKACR